MDKGLCDELDYLEEQKIKREKFLKENAIKLELNKTYLQESSSWAKSHYTIIFVNEEIAVGIQTYCDIYKSNTRGCGSYQLFKSNTGEKYGDQRLEYRLKSLT